MKTITEQIEALGFKKFQRGERYHQKGIILSLSETGDGITISTSKKSRGSWRIDIDHWVFRLQESQIANALRVIKCFWSRNGVKLGERK